MKFLISCPNCEGTDLNELDFEKGYFECLECEKEFLIEECIQIKMEEK